MKHFAKAVLFVFALFGLNGCDYAWIDITEVVWTPVFAHFKIMDQKGKDLLDPDNPENISEKLTLLFRGVTYYPEFIPEFDEANPGQSGWDESKQYHLIIGKASNRWNGMPGGYWLYCGAINGSDDMDEDLVLSIEGKSQWVIHYHCSDHIYGLNATCDRNWTIDGETSESSFFFFSVPQ